MYVMVDFICMGLRELQGHKANEKYKMDISCPYLDSNPVIGSSVVVVINRIKSSL